MVVAELHIFVRFKYFHPRRGRPSISYVMRILSMLPGHFPALRYLLGRACVLNPLIVLPDLNMDHYLATAPSKASWLCALNRHKPLLASKLTDIQRTPLRCVDTRLPHTPRGTVFCGCLRFISKKLTMNGHRVSFHATTKLLLARLAC